MYAHISIAIVFRLKDEDVQGVCDNSNFRNAIPEP